MISNAFDVPYFIQQYLDELAVAFDVNKRRFQ